MELAEYKVGDMVNIWFEPQKDQPGWRGPAELLSINADDGNYSVRIQGRTLLPQAKEVRPHIPYFVDMMYYTTQTEQ